MTQRNYSRRQDFEPQGGPADPERQELSSTRGRSGNYESDYRGPRGQDARPDDYYSGGTYRASDDYGSPQRGDYGDRQYAGAGYWGDSQRNEHRGEGRDFRDPRDFRGSQGYPTPRGDWRDHRGSPAYRSDADRAGPYRDPLYGNPHGNAHGETYGGAYSSPSGGGYYGSDYQRGGDWADRPRPTGLESRNDFDPDYHQWRNEQVRQLDSDYQSWRKDRYKKFADEFSSWRSSRPADTGPNTAQTGDKTEPAAVPGGTGKHKG